jgi:hypothetical protein
VDFTLSGQGSPFLLIIKLIGRFLLWANLIISALIGANVL